MNAFAVILLAFPFYLAQKGRLAAYIQLAKPSAASANANPTSEQSAFADPKLTTTAPASNAGMSSNQASTLDSMTQAVDLFTSASELLG